jgi:hypothetical protein
MKNLFIAAVIAACVATSARADSPLLFEVGGGITQYRAREDGTWWQSNPQLKTNNEFNSLGYQIGMRWPNVRLAFVNLGHYYGDNQFVGDDAKDRYPFQCPTVPADCKYGGKISGNAYGFSLGPVLELFQFWGFTVEGEGGLFAYRSNQKTYVFPLEGQNVMGFDYNRMWGMHKTFYLGAGVTHGGPWSLNYRVYKNIFEQGDTSGGKGGDAGMTGGATQTLFVSYAFQ